MNGLKESVEDKAETNDEDKLTGLRIEDPTDPGLEGSELDINSLITYPNKER